jgi:hypothetical protein
MTDIWHDRERDIVVYSGIHEELLERADNAKAINGSYTALPRSLVNMQIACYLDLPVVPVMDASTYDWPARPGIVPYATQIMQANHMVLHRRGFNFSDMGCIAGETLIETGQGPTPIATLAAAGQPFWVRTRTGYTRAPAPFRKGTDQLYRVTFASGRSISVTRKHYFLTCRGWVSCADLAVGERLPVFDGALPGSISESCLSAWPQDAHRSSQILRDCRDDYRIPAYDARPPLDEGSDQALIPSSNDFLERNRSFSRTDDPGNRHTRSFLNAADRLSSRRYIVRSDSERMEYLPAECDDAQGGNLFRTCRLYLLSSSPARPTAEDRPWDAFADVPFVACDAPMDTIVHITYDRFDVYYDMHVPGEENYIAHGLCHHNTGKTLSALWAADYIMRQHPRGTCRALIVAPLSILDRVWANAIFGNFLSKRTFAILHGTQEKRLEQLARDVDFYIINHDGVGVGAHVRNRFALDGFSKALAEREDIQIAIVDEASGYRDAQTKRHRIARLVYGAKPYLWLMTATPTPNAPTDAYGLAKLVNGAYGLSFTSFRDKTMLKVSQYRWVPQPGGYDFARQHLSPAVRIPIEEVWDGPSCTTQQREVPLSAEQDRLMHRLKQDLQILMKDGKTITAVNEASYRTKFLQISMGAVYDSDHAWHPVDADARFSELEAILDETSRKVVVFCPLTSVIQRLYDKLLGTVGVSVINGSVPLKERSARIARFAADPALRVILCDPAATAHGINEFVAADTVVWFGATDKAELYEQGNGRVHRPGQNYPVTIIQLTSNPLEKEIFRRLEHHQTMQGALLEAVERGDL